MRGVWVLIYQQVGKKSEARCENSVWLLLKKNLKQWKSPEASLLRMVATQGALRGFKEPEATLLMSSRVQRVVEVLSHQNLPPNMGRLGAVLQRKEELPNGHLSAPGEDLPGGQRFS